MRSITVVFEDEEFKKLKQAKKEKSWHDFIMELAEKEEVKTK